jgi:transposase
MSKPHTEEFKQEAIRLATTSPQAIAKTARDLGIKEATLYNWVSVAKNQAPIVADTQGNQVNLIEELNRLRKENARLKEEREILKKAAAFFAKESK